MDNVKIVKLQFCEIYDRNWCPIVLFPYLFSSIFFEAALQTLLFQERGSLQRRCFPAQPAVSDGIAQRGVETEVRVAQGARKEAGPELWGRGVPSGEGSLEGGSHHPALDGLRWAPVSHEGHRRLVLGAGQEAAQLGHLRGKGRRSAPRRTKRTHNGCGRVRDPRLLNKTSKRSTCSHAQSRAAG